MAWIFRSGNDPRGKNTNSVKDFFDSLAAGVTGNTPTWKRQQSIDANRRSTAQTQRVINNINNQRQSNTPVNTGNIASSAAYYGGSPNYGYTAYDPAAAARAAQEARDNAERNNLRGEIDGYGGRSDRLFDDIFRLIKEAAKSRRSKVDKTYNDQDAQYVAQYGEAVPQIDNSFAALGIGNSTYAGDRIDDAKDAMDSALEKSADNRKSDLAEVGNWQDTQLGAFKSDKKNIQAAIGRSKDVEDLGELREARNNVDTTLNNIGGKKSAFQSDGSAIKSLQSKTGRSANFDSAMESLKGVLASSMDTGTKQAAKDALVENANLTDDEKKKLSEVQVNNPYNAPVA